MEFLIDPLYYNWLILAAVFLIIEVASFTLLFLWLTIAAVFMAIISFIFPDVGAGLQLIVFSLLSVASVIIWHKVFKKKQDKLGDSRMNNRAARYIGRTVTLVEGVENNRGKVQIDDSFWRVECDEDLPAGQSVIVTDAKDVILYVRKK